jgi:hypothetical protein
MKEIVKKEGYIFMKETVKEGGLNTTQGPIIPKVTNHVNCHPSILTRS